MLPKVNIAPAIRIKGVIPLSVENPDSSPADTSGTNMYENLARARFRAGFFNQMNLVRWIVECSDVCVGRWPLSRLQDSEFRMIQDLLRIVDFCLADGLCCHLLDCQAR